jgi:DNA repair exonuclease SbcCD ATPase subunit
MKLKYFLFTISLLSASFIGFSQEDINSINSQFEEVIENSNNYQDYKVVKRFKLSELQKNTAAKINTLNQEIEASKKIIQEQKASIENLKSQLNETENKLNQITQEKDEISFFGIPTQKGTYQTIMWVIVFTLVLILVFFIYKYKKSNVLTKEAKNNLAEYEAEFEDYRKSALEKQQKLGRQLQDEKNKQTKNNH